MTDSGRQHELIRVGRPMKRIKMNFEPASPFDGPVTDGPLIPVGRPMKWVDLTFESTVPINATSPAAIKAFGIDESTLGKFINPDDQKNARKSILHLNIQAAATELPEEEYAVFDLIVMGARTITEAAEELQIPQKTAMDRYNSALAGVRRTIKNDPGVRLLFDALLDLFEDRK